MSNQTPLRRWRGPAVLSWVIDFHWEGKSWDFKATYNGADGSLYINLDQLNEELMSLEDLNELCEFLTKLKETINNGPK